MRSMTNQHLISAQKEIIVAVATKERSHDCHGISLAADAGRARGIRGAGRSHGRARRHHAGLHSHKGFFAEDGERVSIVEFESEESLRAWRMHPEHRVEQRKAREIYYQDYSVQICQMLRETSFKRDPAP
jgi:hypothetical protein